MHKQNRQPGIHLHATKKYREKKIKGTSIHQKSVSYTEYYWILIARNGKTIARSSETYKRKGSAVRSMLLVGQVFLEDSHYYDRSKGDGEIKFVDF